MMFKFRILILFFFFLLWSYVCYASMDLFSTRNKKFLILNNFLLLWGLFQVTLMVGQLLGNNQGPMWRIFSKTLCEIATFYWFLQLLVLWAYFLNSWLYISWLLGLWHLSFRTIRDKKGVINDVCFIYLSAWLNIAK